jgi:acetamidase/formamidase
MKAVQLTFDVLKDHPALDFPFANTPNGWITFCFDENLNKAALKASDHMLLLMSLLYGFTREEALPYASLLVDL